MWSSFRNLLKVGALIALILDRLDKWLIELRKKRERKERQDALIKKARDAGDAVTSIDDLRPDDFRD